MVKARDNLRENTVDATTPPRWQDEANQQKEKEKSVASRQASAPLSRSRDGNGMLEKQKMGSALHDNNCNNSSSSNNNNNSGYNMSEQRKKHHHRTTKQLAFAPAMYRPDERHQQERYESNNDDMEQGRAAMSTTNHEPAEVGAIHVGPYDALESLYITTKTPKKRHDRPSKPLALAHSMYRLDEHYQHTNNDDKEQRQAATSTTNHEPRGAIHVGPYDALESFNITTKKAKKHHDSPSKPLALAPAMYRPDEHYQQEGYETNNYIVEQGQAATSTTNRKPAEVGAIHVGPYDALESFYITADPEGEDTYHSIHEDIHDDMDSFEQVLSAHVSMVRSLPNTRSEKEKVERRTAKKKKIWILAILLVVVALALGLGLGVPQTSSATAIPPRLTSPAASPTESYPPSISGTEWVQLGQELNGASAIDLFGQWVSLSGDGTTLAVASGNETDHAYARTYRLQENVWTLFGDELLLDTASTVALSLDGSTIAVGTAGVDTMPGVFQAYEWSDVSGLWSPRDGSPVVGETPWFGFYAAISRDGLVVAVTDFEVGGSIVVKEKRVGRVHLFRWDQSQNTWLPLGHSIDSEVSELVDDVCVAINVDGSVVAIGTSQMDGHAGFARVYESAIAQDGQTVVWIQRGADLTHSNERPVIGTDMSLSDDGTVVAVGHSGVSTHNQFDDYGSVYVLAFDALSSVWIQRGDTFHGQNLDSLGQSVSISGDGSVLAFGAPSPFTVAVDPGYVSVVHWVRGSWVELGSRLDNEQGISFGWSVSLSSDGRRVAVGDLYNGASGENAGSVQVFELSAT